MAKIGQLCCKQALLQIKLCKLVNKDIFIQGTLPATFDIKYRKTVDYLARRHLVSCSAELLFAKICFLKSFTGMNKHLIDAAITKSILLRPDFSNDILNPIEVRMKIFYLTSILKSINMRLVQLDPDIFFQKQKGGCV